MAASGVQRVILLRDESYGNETRTELWAVTYLEIGSMDTVVRPFFYSIGLGLLPTEKYVMNSFVNCLRSFE